MRIIGGLGVVDKYQMKDEMKIYNSEEESVTNKMLNQIYFSKRKKSIELKSLENKSDEQLKLYYDELLLLQSNTNK
jgi:uncharacterized membrane protein